ncbi:MAG: ROK family protein [Haloechinothrix sp.]
MNPVCVIAVDVGGTRMKAAVVDDHAKVLVARQQPTHRAEGAEAVVHRITALVRELMAVATDQGAVPVGVGVVVPGIVDEAAGVAVASANMGWRNVPVRALLENATAVPVAFGHDVRAGGLAEAVLGAGRGAGDFLFLPIGTGIAGAVVLSGRPYSGGGFAGEIGHVVVQPGGRPCPCGAAGCLETVASADAIARAYQERSGERSTAEQVMRRAAKNDHHAVAVWDEALDALATALVAYTSMLAPELIVVGGGLASSGARLLEPLQTLLAARLTFQRAPKLQLAELGDQSGCLGAALLAWERLGRQVTG